MLLINSSLCLSDLEMSLMHQSHSSKQHGYQRNNYYEFQAVNFWGLNASQLHLTDTKHVLSSDDNKLYTNTLSEELISGAADTGKLNKHPCKHFWFGYWK